MHPHDREGALWHIGEVMNIIIIGCGKIGQALAEQLNNEGHDITIVDKNEKLIRELAMSLDVIGVSGNGAILDVQKEAGVDRADVLIATTNSDEQNMLICLIAKKVGHPETICRIRNFEYEGEIDYLKEALGISMVVNPEKLTAHEISHLLSFPSAIQIETFSSGRAEMVKMKIPAGSPLLGVALRDLHKRIAADVLISMVERGQNVIIPSGNTIFEEGDTISFIANPNEAMFFSRKCNLEFHPHHNACFIGGGRITNYLCAERKKSNRPMNFKVFETKPESCALLSERYPDVIVINGDGTDQKLLDEEGLQQADVLVTMTGIDEQNVMMSLILRERYPNLRVITKVNHLSPEDVPESLGIGSLVCPKRITADAVTRFVRASENSANSSIESLYKLAGGKAEAQEYQIHDEPAITGVCLKDLPLKENILIAAILRKGQLVRPTGSDKILPGDHIVIIALADMNIRALKDILRK